jgi:hypothetical protein
VFRFDYFSKKDPVRIVLYMCLLGHLWLVHRQANPSDVELSGLVTISIGLVQVKQLSVACGLSCRLSTAVGSLLKITLGASSE